jgi:Zn-dependent protease
LNLFGGIDQEVIISRLLLLILLWISLGVHEWAHAWTAWKLGDDTAAMMGRLTLNPLAHLDPIGTVLLPLLGVPFGWAKPVPVQPTRFRRNITMRKGMMLVAIAGPVANLAQVVVGTMLLFLLVRVVPHLFPSIEPDAQVKILQFLVMYVSMNIGLAIFNFIPIPPLDGSRVADALMPRSLYPLWAKFCSQAPIALAVLIILPSISGFNFLNWPIMMVFKMIGAILHIGL